MGSVKIKACREIKVGSTLEATSIARMINLIQMLSRSDICIYSSFDRVRRVIAMLFHTDLMLLHVTGPFPTYTRAEHLIIQQKSYLVKPSRYYAEVMECQNHVVVFVNSGGLGAPALQKCSVTVLFTYHADVLADFAHDKVNHALTCRETLICSSIR